MGYLIHFKKLKLHKNQALQGLGFFIIYALNPFLRKRLDSHPLKLAQFKLALNHHSKS